jgi:hypothetical protein
MLYSNSYNKVKLSKYIIFLSITGIVLYVITIKIVLSTVYAYYLITDLLTELSLEKLPIVQLLKNFLAF